MQKSNYLSTQPYKGARDFYPEDMAIRNYMFDTWRRICRRFGYEEYDFPILEPFEIFAAKTGEEIVNEQLFAFEDKAGRKLAIRPEITPGTVRMIAARYQELAKPIRWFMIGNNWRFEKPQRGRGREFFQLEVNIFGENDVRADFEIFSIIIAIMEAFGATQDMFEIFVNDRRLISALLQDELKLDEEVSSRVRTVMDKRTKLTDQAFKNELSELGLDATQIEKNVAFMDADFESLKDVIPSEILDTNEGYQSIKTLFSYLEENDILRYCQFSPAIIRGFDYSDGLVYEVFDKNPDNNRSMFGGERFDRLINIFGDFDLAATGFAMGDVTLQNFLESWKLLPVFASSAEVYATLWNNEAEYFNRTYDLVYQLREKKIGVEMALDGGKSLGKQFNYANKKEIPWVTVIGENELEKGTVTLKNMQTGEQKECASLDDVVEMIQSGKKN